MMRDRVMRRRGTVDNAAPRGGARSRARARARARGSGGNSGGQR